MKINWDKHHILPIRLGGTDEPSNLLKCNKAMHAFMHMLLWEEHGKYEDWIAWKALSGSIGNDEILIEKAKLGGYNARKSLVKHFSNPENRLKKIEPAKKAREKWWNNLSKEQQRSWLEKVSGKGRKQPQSQKDAVSKANKGKIFTQEHKNNLSTSHKTESVKQSILARYNNKWIIGDPEGIIHESLDLTGFCDKYNLSRGAMGQLANGKRTYYKGYSCQKVNRS